MKGILSDNQRNYLFYHLNFFVDLNDELKSRISFNASIHSETQAKIVFPQSEKPFDVNQIILIQDIPVLFPISEINEFYSVQGNSVIFHHDMLKSAFYLLSGYQETITPERDFMGRFPYEKSIQKKLGIVSKPVVNYYFDIITAGIKTFCELNHISFTKKRMFDTFGYMLSHDIDRVDAYNIWEVGHKLKQCLGLSATNYSKSAAWLVFATYFVNWLNPFNKKNPYWNFEYLRTIEKQYDIHSTFYFLENETLHLDSRYSFSEKRIVKLIAWLESEGCEIGVHGTIKSAKNSNSVLNNLRHLQQVSKQTIIGIRQHCLHYELPFTATIQEQAGFSYDTTLTFAEHEGFRNSCCTPFKPYDFAGDRMIDVWEIPLTIMDGTLFYYRKLSFEQMWHETEKLLNEVQRFHGIFALLWHNTMFDEAEFPGITAFYEQYQRHILSRNPQSVTGVGLMNKLVVL